MRRISEWQKRCATDFLYPFDFPHPEIPKGLIFDNTGVWDDFLASLLAVQHDVEQARLVYREAPCS